MHPALRLLTGLLAAALAPGCRDKAPATPLGDGGATTDGGDADGGTDGGGTDTAPSGPWAGVVEGLVADAGFGAAVAVAGDRLVVGAPHGATGVVFELEEGAAVALQEGDGRRGSSLAAWTGSAPDGYVVGAPLGAGGVGQLYDQGGALLAGDLASLGLALAGGSQWVAAYGEGLLDQAGATTALDGRPSSLALDAAGRVGVGFARGPVALQVGDLLLARPAVADEAGYAIAVADLDGDGVAEWLLGAPGAAVVYVVSEAGGALSVSRTLAGDGRFGQALALADVDGDGAVDLLVGAPGAGDTAAGAAVLYAGPDLTEADRWEGDRDGAQLGFAVAMAPGTALIGAPGGAGDVGRVTVARSPSPER